MSDRINNNVPIVQCATPPVVDLIASGAKAYMMNGCRIIVSNDPGQGWHISISRKDRDPTWAEIATARYRLLPDVEEMVMHLPPMDEYVNISVHCFHLHEFKRSALILP